MKKPSAAAAFDVIEPLPRDPFLMVVQAPVRGGKSNLVSNLLGRFYCSGERRKKSLFDTVVIASPTVLQDASLEPVRELVTAGGGEPIIIDQDLEAFDEKYLPALIEALLLISPQEKSKAKDSGAKQTLLLVDDMLGMLGRNFNYLCTRYRHYRLSIIVTSQNFRSVPPIVRHNATCYVLFTCRNARERAKFLEEFSDSFGAEFERAYEAATRPDYGFLFVDMQHRQLWDCFTSQLLQAKAAFASKSLS